MLSVLQDVMNEPQNWTLVGILGTVLVAVIGLLVWIVKWLCTRFATTVDKCTEVTGDSTQTLSLLHETVTGLKESINEMPQRTVDELQRRRLSS